MKGKLRAISFGGKKLYVILRVTMNSSTETSKAAFLNRRAAARYRALASVIPGRKRFSWNLSF
jgi:hypothetical protein